jgi:pyruvate kinase
VKIRRTRIICTLGPATASQSMLKRLVGAGMDVARVNFSHGDADTHRAAAEGVRAAARAGKRQVALLQDLQGPKIRTGALNEHTVKLMRGRPVTLTARHVVGGESVIPVSHAELVRSLHPDDRVLLADGQIELGVRAVSDIDAGCVVTRGGVLGERKGVTVPGRLMPMPALTPKDLKDLEVGAELEFDYVALSFVRRAADVHACRAALEKVGWRVPVVAKLEKQEALSQLDSILDCSDGIMVARGDLGVELPLGEVPAVQKDIIARANRRGVPVITATEMLESMVTTNRPTRAEASDVANAIWDGTDAVMLSQETSTGEHPLEAVRAMATICLAAESHPAYQRERPGWVKDGSTAAAIAHAAAAVADEVSARVIVAFTESGSTALAVSKANPTVPVVAASPHPDSLRKTCLYPGVVALQVEHGDNTDDMIAKAKQAALRSGLVRRRDRIVVVAGVPVRETGRTNLIKVENIE